MNNKNSHNIILFLFLAFLFYSNLALSDQNYQNNKTLNQTLAPISRIIELANEAKFTEIIGKFIEKIKSAFKPLRFKDIPYNLKEESYDNIKEIIGELLIEEGEQFLQQLRPEILQKLIMTYQSSIILGQTQEQKKNAIKALIKKILTMDEFSEYIKTNNLQQLNRLNDQNVFKYGYILYQKIKLGNDKAYHQLDLLLNDGLSNELKEELDKEITENRENLLKGSSFSIFFNAKNSKNEISRIENPNTFTIFDYIFWAYTNQMQGIEIALDFLPFDHSKRLPNEYSNEEKEKIYAFSQLLGVKISVHSPLVGPFTAGGHYFMDPTDNINLYKESIKFCQDIGAESLVVHIVEKESNNMRSMAELLNFAEKYNVKVAFENSHDKNKKYITADEFCTQIKEIVRFANKGAIRNLAVTFDSAHYNIVDTLEDPVVALIKIFNLAKELNLDEETYKSFLKELHLNQNLGPILYAFGFGADIHEDLERNGPINNAAIISLAYALGFEPLVIAEQAQTVSQNGLRMIHNSVKNGISKKLDNTTIEGFKEQNPEVMEIIKNINKKNPDDVIERYYSTNEQILAYNLLYEISGKNYDALRNHILSREMLHIFIADGKFIEIDGYPRVDLDDGEELFKIHTPSNEMYMIIEGEAELFDENNELIATLKSGSFVGEIGIIKNIPRTATVKANGSLILRKITKEKYNELQINFPIYANLISKHSDIRLSDTAKKFITSLWNRIKNLKEVNLNEIIKGFLISIHNEEILDETDAFNQMIELAKADSKELIGEKGIYKILPLDRTDNRVRSSEKVFVSA
ncbi:MAG: mechanosensitive ion channel protein MscS [uncultured bacterium]|nr:MAG: mechanosensitive ion channel protein MscS [uncultured bacterium]